MTPNNQSPDHHVAYGAFIEGFASATSSFVVVGRYIWNMQMNLLKTIGAMRFFKAQPWLFAVLAFFLLAFALPVGIMFVVSAFCAGSLNPKVEDDFIVLLKPIQLDAVQPETEQASASDISGATADRLDFARNAASIHYVGFLRASDTDMTDAELAATALGTLDGTLQAQGVVISSQDMHLAGAAFVVEQLQQLDRLEDHDPDKIADLTVTAMSSAALAPAREKASMFAFKAEQLTGLGQSQF